MLIIKENEQTLSALSLFRKLCAGASIFFIFLTFIAFYINNNMAALIIPFSHLLIAILFFYTGRISAIGDDKLIINIRGKHVVLHKSEIKSFSYHSFFIKSDKPKRVTVIVKGTLTTHLAGLYYFFDNPSYELEPYLKKLAPVHGASPVPGCGAKYINK